MGCIAQVTPVILSLSSQSAFTAQWIVEGIVIDVWWEREGSLVVRSLAWESSDGSSVVVALVVGGKNSDDDIDASSTLRSSRLGECMGDIDSLEPSALGLASWPFLDCSLASNLNVDSQHPPASIWDSSFVGLDFNINFIVEFVGDEDLSDDVTSFSDQVKVISFTSFFRAVGNAYRGISAWLSSGCIGNVDVDSLNGRISTGIGDSE